MMKAMHNMPGRPAWLAVCTPDEYNGLELPELHPLTVGTEEYETAVAERDKMREHKEMLKKAMLEKATIFDTRKGAAQKKRDTLQKVGARDRIRVSVS